MALISRMPELGDVIAISAFWKLKSPPLQFFQEQILKVAAHSFWELKCWKEGRAHGKSLGDSPRIS